MEGGRTPSTSMGCKFWGDHCPGRRGSYRSIQVGRVVVVVFPIRHIQRILAPQFQIITSVGCMRFVPPCRHSQVQQLIFWVSIKLHGQRLQVNAQWYSIVVGIYPSTPATASSTTARDRAGLSRDPRSKHTIPACRAEESKGGGIC